MANEAIERLITMGLLQKKGTRWCKSAAKISFTSKYSSSAIREYHKQMIQKATENLENATREAFEKRSINGITLSVNPNKLNEVFDKIDQFRKDIEECMSEGELTEVYQLNVQLFNLTHQPKN